MTFATNTDAALASPPPAFDHPALLPWLEAASPSDLDALPFGVVRLDAAGAVAHYNATESRRAGLAPERVLGRRFFADVAPCADTPEVGGRFDAEAELDATMDHVFAFRLRVSPVRLRLLRSASATHRYLLVIAR